MMDPRFIMSVTLLCLHDDDGSFGLILNRPAPVFIDPVTFTLHQEHRLEYFPVYLGGPVEPENLFFIFRSDHHIENTTEILPGVYLSSSPKALSKHQELNSLDNSTIRFFLGYAGWSFFQLDCEISNGSWFTHPASLDLTLFTSPEDLWLESLKSIGPDFYNHGFHFLDSLE